MRIYISGNTNETLSQNDPNSYKHLENELLKEGHKIVNKSSIYSKIDSKTEKDLLKDMELLAGAEAIYFLKDWTTSRKSIIEKLFAELTGKVILFQEEIRDKRQEREQQQFLLLRIEGAVEEVTGLKLTDYRKETKERELFYARMLFAYNCRLFLFMPEEIGKLIQRDHTTVRHYLRKYEDELKYNNHFQKMANKVKYILNHSGNNFY